MALALKPVYQAAAATVARERLEDFDRGPWGQKYPAIAQSWRRNWEQVIPFFAFAPELRKILRKCTLMDKSVHFRNTLHHQCHREPERAGPQGGAGARPFSQ